MSSVYPKAWQIFSSWDDATRRRALLYVVDSSLWKNHLHLQAQAANDNDDAMWVIGDSHLEKLVLLWAECDGDLVMTRLRWQE